MGDSRHRSQIDPTTAALFSLMIPGLGLFLRGYRQQASVVLLLSVLSGLLISSAGYWVGLGTAVFLGILVLFPWWIFQSYHTSLPVPEGITNTWQRVWDRGHDIRYLGGLFLFAAIMDLSIILQNPEYQLHVFCTRPRGVLGALAKLQSPFFHVLIGYGFLRVLRWGLFAYLLYAGYGLTNALANFACEGYGRIRMVFFCTLIGFTLYIFLRRHCFFSK